MCIGLGGNNGSAHGASLVEHRGLAELDLFGFINGMYSMDNLLRLLHSDGADELRLHVGEPPVIVLDGEPQLVEGPALTIEDTAQLLQGVATTRQRRELRKHGVVEFMYRFRRSTPFVVRARLENENVGIDIH